MVIKKINIIVNAQKGKMNENSINNIAITAVNNRRIKDKYNNYVAEVLNIKTREQYFIIDDDLKARLKERSNILKPNKLKSANVGNLSLEFNELTNKITVLQEEINNIKASNRQAIAISSKGVESISEDRIRELIQEQTASLQAVKGDKGDKGDTGEKGEKGDKGDTPSLKTINGESLIGDGDIIIQNSIDINPLQTELAEVKANNTTLNSRLDLLANNIVDLFNTFLKNTNQGSLDEFVRWSPVTITNDSNVFGGSASAIEDVISFNNQKSAFLAPQDVTGIKFKLRAPNNPGQYILWLVASVNSSDESDIRSLTVDFQTYIEATYTNWIKSKQGHTSYDGLHGATAQNIKDVFNVHNVEITVVVEDGKIKCSNALGFKFEINAFAGSGFVTRLGLGSQNGFSNNVQAYDIKILRSSEAA